MAQEMMEKMGEEVEKTKPKIDEEQVKTSTKSLLQKTEDSGRKWTKIQLIGIKAAIVFLLGRVLWDEAARLDSSTEFHALTDWFTPRYLYAITLIASYYIINRYEQDHDLHEDERELRKTEKRMTAEAKLIAMYTFFQEVFPKAGGTEKQLELLNDFHLIIGSMSLKDITRTTREGFTMVADAMGSIIEETTKIKKEAVEIKDQAVSNIDEKMQEVKKLFGEITGNKRPRKNIDIQKDLLPKQSQINEE